MGDFFQDRDGIWWFWFFVATVTIVSGIISFGTGIGWDDPSDSGVCEGLSDSAFERCMDNILDREQNWP